MSSSGLTPFNVEECPQMYKAHTMIVFVRDVNVDYDSIFSHQTWYTILSMASTVVDTSHYLGKAVCTYINVHRMAAYSERR